MPMPVYQEHHVFIVSGQSQMHINCSSPAPVWLYISLFSCPCRLQLCSACVGCCFFTRVSRKDGSQILATISFLVHAAETIRLLEYIFTAWCGSSGKLKAYTSLNWQLLVLLSTGFQLSVKYIESLSFMKVIVGQSRNLQLNSGLYVTTHCIQCIHCAHLFRIHPVHKLN